MTAFRSKNNLSKAERVLINELVRLINKVIDFEVLPQKIASQMTDLKHTIIHHLREVRKDAKD